MTVFSGFLVNWEETAVCLVNWYSLGAEIKYKLHYSPKQTSIWRQYFTFFDGKVLWQAALCLAVLRAVGTEEQGKQCGPWEGGLGGGRLHPDPWPWKGKGKQHMVTLFYSDHPAEFLVCQLKTSKQKIRVTGNECSC